MAYSGAVKESEFHANFHPGSIRDKFLELYAGEPVLVRSPGRINLIGEHTDYNDGFVMPAAIDRDIVYAVGFSKNDESVLYSVKHNEVHRFSVDNPSKVSEPQWANYLLGVVRRFLDKGFSIKPFYCVVGGDVPTGAGLSSSAALECGLAFALDHIHSFSIPKIELLHIAQWAEHHYAGVLCGIMDQFASMMGAEGNAFVLDCRSLEYHYFPIDLKEYSLVLCDTMVKHSLANTAYNERREECEKGVSILKAFYPHIKKLRDVTEEMIEAKRQLLPGRVYDRCSFIVQENARVLAASEDLKSGNLREFGQKMYASHQGLSQRYQVSCKELDFLVEQARVQEGVLGSRMMGGGFGGCTINIVLKTKIESFVSTLEDAYVHQFNLEMNHYVVDVRNGTSLVAIEDLQMPTPSKLDIVINLSDIRKDIDKNNPI